MKKTALSLIVLAASGAAFAQSTVSGVQGLVTATSGNQLVNVTSGMTLPPGAVISATGNGSVTISMPGCAASLGPGQTMTNTLQGCKEFVASSGTPSGSPGAGGAVFTAGNLALGAGGAGLLAYNVNRNRRGNGATVVLPTTPGTPAVVTPPTRPSRS
jgi:hypothetical protein